MHKAIKIITVLVFMTSVVSGQKLVNSPYARFGMGTLDPAGPFRVRSMGGAGAASRDPLTINFLNPASLSAVDTNSFVFDFGFDFQVNKLSNADMSDISDDMNIHHIMMAFPIGRKMGFAIGLSPFSSGYYNISTKVTEGDPGYDPITGETESLHKGVGGYNNAMLAYGVKPLKGLSAGVSMNFLFGEITRENVFYFREDNNYYNNLKRESVLLRGFNLTWGIQYELDLKNDFFAVAGISLADKKNYKAEYENSLSKFTAFSGSQYTSDTLAYTYDDNATVTLPRQISFGLSVGKRDQFTIIAGYSMANWKEASFLGYEDNFANSSSFNLGAEIIPSKYANYNYLNRVEYRVGGHLGKSSLFLNNEQLKEFGITFGAGFPLNRTKSRINLHFEYGYRKGSFENGLHKEGFINLGLSFNFYDYWFIKRKYE